MENTQPFGPSPSRQRTHYDNKPNPCLSAMGTELQRHILSYAVNDPAGLLGVFHASDSLSRVANEALQAGRCLETSSEANHTALDLAEYLFTSDGVNRPLAHGGITKDATTDRVMVMASMFTTLNIVRHPPHRNEAGLHSLNDGTMAKYKKTINSFRMLSPYYKKEWCEALSRGEDRAILRVLLSVLRVLSILHLHGIIHYLPLRCVFEITAGLSTLHTLELSAITDKMLSDSCRYIMALASLQELIFSDMSATQVKVRNLQARTL